MTIHLMPPHARFAGGVDLGSRSASWGTHAMWVAPTKHECTVCLTPSWQRGCAGSECECKVQPRYVFLQRVCVCVHMQRSCVNGRIVYWSQQELLEHCISRAGGRHPCPAGILSKGCLGICMLKGTRTPYTATVDDCLDLFVCRAGQSTPLCIELVSLRRCEKKTLHSTHSCQSVSPRSARHQAAFRT